MINRLLYRSIPERKDSGLEWFVENMPSGYLEYPQHYIYGAALDVEVLEDTTRRRRDFKKLLIDRQVSEGIDMPEVNQEDLKNFIGGCEDVTLKIERSLALSNLIRQYRTQVEDIREASRLAFLELFHKEAPLRVSEMDEDYFRNRELIKHDLEAYTRELGEDKTPLDLSTNNASNEVICSNGELVKWAAYLHRAKRFINTDNAGIVEILIYFSFNINSLHKEDEEGVIIFNGVVHRTASGWSREFANQGVSISPSTIRKLLKDNDRAGRNGKDRSGRTLEGVYFSELDVRKSCIYYFETFAERMERAKMALVSKGVVDRQTLINFGPGDFKKSFFPGFGRGTAFASAILGETVSDMISFKHLHRIADVLGFPEIDLEKLKLQYIKALADNNIVDRVSLIAFGIKRFARTTFVPFGKGRALATAILGESISGSLSDEHLHRIADVLGFPKLNINDLKKKYLFALSVNGISDRYTLFKFGSNDFRGANFPPYGKGTAFATEVLTTMGLITERVKSVSNVQLNLIADALELPRLSNQTRESIFQALNEHGISDRESLVGFQVVRFMETNFHPFGAGRAFAGVIFGKKIRSLHLRDLSRIADELGW